MRMCTAIILACNAVLTGFSHPEEQGHVVRFRRHRPAFLFGRLHRHWAGLFRGPERAFRKQPVLEQRIHLSSSVLLDSASMSAYPMLVYSR